LIATRNITGCCSPSATSIWVLTQAAISAELVVSLMDGETPSIDPRPYRVDRF
jgi:glycine/D-amino acid oxidase-like deaminating enzyme